MHRRRPFHERLEQAKKPAENEHQEAYDSDEFAIEDDTPEPASPTAPNPDEGEEGWRNSEGERLNDFGVDEDVEFYDEDDLPLAELVRRRNTTQYSR